MSERFETKRCMKALYRCFPVPFFSYSNGSERRAQKHHKCRHNYLHNVSEIAKHCIKTNSLGYRDHDALDIGTLFTNSDDQFFHKIIG